MPLPDEINIIRWQNNVIFRTNHRKLKKPSTHNQMHLLLVVPFDFEDLKLTFANRGRQSVPKLLFSKLRLKKTLYI